MNALEIICKLETDSSIAKILSSLNSFVLRWGINAYQILVSISVH